MRWRAAMAWGAAYLLMVGSLTVALYVARARLIAHLESPAAQAEWEAWRSAEAARAADSTAPVRRRIPKSSEPPGLVLARDHFPAAAVTLLAVSSVMFLFVMLVARSWTSKFRENDE